MGKPYVDEINDRLWKVLKPIRDSTSVDSRWEMVCVRTTR